MSGSWLHGRLERCRESGRRLRVAALYRHSKLDVLGPIGAIAVNDLAANRHAGLLECLIQYATQPIHVGVSDDGTRQHHVLMAICQYAPIYAARILEETKLNARPIGELRGDEYELVLQCVATLPAETRDRISCENSEGRPGIPLSERSG